MTFPQFVQNPTAINLAGLSASTWTTFASGAPAGATGMAALIVGNSGTQARELRKTGSSDTFTADTIASSQQVVRFTGLNGSGQFDYWSAGGNQTSDLIYPLAYFGPEATFPTNQIIMGSTLTTSFVNNYSTGGNAPSAIAAVFAIHGGNDVSCYFRHPSSTDTLQNGNESTARRDWFCALNGSQQYSAIAGTAGRQPYLVCYFTSNVVEANAATHNVVVRTPGTAGSYQNLSSSGDTNPIGTLYYLRSPSASEAFQLSGLGTAWSAPNQVPCGTLAGLGLAYTPAQANIASTVLVINELAYFTAGGVANALAWIT